MKTHHKKSLPNILKHFCLLLGMLFFGFSNLSAQGKAGFALEGLKSVATGDEYSMPIWSPDGSKLLLSTAHGMRLRMLDLTTNSLVKLSDVRGSGFDASWSPDGQNIYYRHKDNDLQVHPEIMAIQVKGLKKRRSTLHPNGLLSASKATSDEDPVIFINVETLGIEAQTKDQSECWKITKDNGQYYRPLLSPDKKQLIVHQGSEMLLYAMDGSGLIRSLGTGIASSWSPDGQHVIAFLDESKDGHQISGSELYLIDIALGKTSKLTTTPNIYEMWPNWSANGKQIAFEDANSGHIYVADIVKQ